MLPFYNCMCVFSIYRLWSLVTGEVYHRFHKIQLGYRGFIQRSKIEIQDNGFLTGDVLKVHVDLELFKPSSYLLCQQMESVMGDEKLSDIQVKTSTRSFHASKVILAGTHNNNYEVHTFMKNWVYSFIFNPMFNSNSM